MKTINLLNRYQLATCLLFAVVISSCNRQIEIGSLKSEVTGFETLPDSVRAMFEHPDRFEVISGSRDILYLTKNSYSLEVVESGPFTDYFIITDVNSKKKFKVPYGKPFPFVIYNDELFIANKYNVGNSVDPRTVRFERYSLSRKRE